MKFFFTKKSIHVQEFSEFVLEITSFLPDDITLTDVITEFSNSLVVTSREKESDGDDQELKFSPNVPRRFSFKIMPPASGYLKVSTISMVLGKGRSKVSFVYIPDYSLVTMSRHADNQENKDILM